MRSAEVGAAPVRPVVAPIVAIIGRPNVGKSRLFNRLIGRRVAIVEDQPGVTRDRQYGTCAYRGRAFTVVDTGGLDAAPAQATVKAPAKPGVAARVAAQSRQAMEEADAVILLLDGKDGVTPTDEDIVRRLMRSSERRGRGPQVVVAVNKLDRPPENAAVQTQLAEFHRLGLSPLYPISAEHGYGVDDLLDAILPLLPEATSATRPAGPPCPRIAVIGRPNVGKSTLINTILGEARLVTDEQPGTTRDPVDTFITYRDAPYCLVDTAGIRRRGRTEPGVEQYSVGRAREAAARADVAVLVLDGVEGVTEQDTKLAGWILDEGKGLVVAINKWDLAAAEPGRKGAVLAQVDYKLRFLPASPVLFVSALTGKGLPQLLGAVKDVSATHATRVVPARLAEITKQLAQKGPLAAGDLRVRSLTQVATRPPTFLLRINRPEMVQPAGRRFIEHRVREALGLAGVPVRLLVRSAPAGRRRPARRRPR